MNDLKGTENLAKLLFRVLKEYFCERNPKYLLMEFKEVLDPLKKAEIEMQKSNVVLPNLQQRIKSRRDNLMLKEPISRKYSSYLRYLRKPGITFSFAKKAKLFSYNNRQNIDRLKYLINKI